jgi:2-polyprenyl-3-methyl-5-hydroxy-6-metoxy-1,4-benzoquinol methylase
MKSPGAHSEFTQEDVSAANVAVYETGAGHYDERVLTADSHARLKRILELAVTMVRRASASGREVSCLDVAGGTGNASWLLDEMGCAATMVDISPAMVQQFSERCQREGRSINAQCVDAVEYLNDSNHTGKFDLIVFSSALHHFRHPDQIVGTAMGLWSLEGSS